MNPNRAVITAVCCVGVLALVAGLATLDAYWATVATQIAPVVGLLVLVAFVLSILISRD